MYSERFYDEHKSGSERSAEIIVPIILGLVKPKSVVDLGCGVGAWLAEFMRQGLTDVVGIDGEWVEKRVLRIPEQLFLTRDLKQPVTLDRSFDLAMSLEVAEHLPDECAESFVNSLVNLAPVVLFSAAVPFQRGTNHVNEQWPDYWVDLFEKKEYLVVDAVRRKVWQNDNIEVWYAQNILFFVKEGRLEDYSLLKQARMETRTDQLSIIHPRMFVERADLRNYRARDLLRIAPSIAAAPTIRKIKRAYRKLKKELASTR